MKRTLLTLIAIALLSAGISAQSTTEERLTALESTMRRIGIDSTSE